MLSSDKKLNLGLLTKILVLVGAVNWGVTAARMQSTDEVRDLIHLLNKELKLPVDVKLVQKTVYAAVTLSAIAMIAQSRSA